MEQYDFIILVLFPIPRIACDENLKPFNFQTREQANEVIDIYGNAIIIDIKKLQSEKEIDDMAANVGW